MIRLRTLGALDLRAADGGELRSVLSQPKRLAILAYLVLAKPRGPHQRETLIALFWPELGTENARNALSQAVHFLRRSLGADIITNRGTNELAARQDLLWCDAIEFERRLDDGKLAEAVELYGGDLLQGFHLDESAEFERWLESERDRLRRREVAALEALATRSEEAADFGGAVIWWRRLAARDPYSSRFALRLMRALASSGDPAAAVHHARAHEALLASELEVAADPEIAAFAERLRAMPTGARVPTSARPVQEETKPAIGTRLIRRTPTVAVGAGIIALCAMAVIAFSSAPWNRWGNPATERPLDLHSLDSATQAYLQDLMQKGRHAEVNRSHFGLQTAMQAYRHAIEREPRYAPAYAGLATVHNLMAEYNYAPTRSSLDSARANALKALALDSTLAAARTAHATSLANDGYFKPAEAEFRRAIALDGNSAAAHYYFAILLVALNRGEEALVEAERSLSLERFSPRGPTTMKRWAMFLMTGKRSYKQLPVAKRQGILDDEPGEPWALAREAMDYAEEERCEEAKVAITEAQRLVPAGNLRMIPFTGTVLWFCNEREKAAEMLRAMKQQPDIHDEGIRVAWLHARFGEADSAMAWLEQQPRWSVIELAGLSANEVFDPIRGHPRFPRLLRELRSGSRRVSR